MTPVEFYFNLNNLLYLLIVLGAASLLFYAEKLEKSDKIKFDRVNRHISYIFLGLLILMAVQYIVPATVLEWVGISLMMITVVLGIVAFYLNMSGIGDIEKEGRQERIGEEKRELEFAGKFPGINRVWGLRRIIKWMYKEGWRYSLTLLIIGFTILTIKISAGSWNSPQGQFHQIRAALGIIRTGLPIWDSGVMYIRAVPFTYMLAVSIKLFGFNMVGMRFTSVLFSVLTSFILYLLLKQSFSKNIGLLGFAFFNFLGMTFSPFLTHRFYSMGLFFIYLSLFFLIKYDTDLNKKNKYLFFICSYFSIIVTDVGLITLVLYLLKPALSFNWKIVEKRVKDKYSFIYIISVPILYKFSQGYIIPSYIIIDEFTRQSFASEIPFIRKDLLFVYFLEKIFNSWGIWFILGILCTLIYILICKKKRDKLFIYLLGIIIIGYIFISVLSPFKQVPRIPFFMIPAIALTIIFPFGIIFYEKIRKNMLLIIMLALAIAVIIDPFSIQSGLWGKGGDRIPEGSLETESWKSILTWKDQIEYLNTQYREGDRVFTSNLWLDFYFKGKYNYSIIVPGIMQEGLYQIYSDHQRYLETNIITYYEYDELNKLIIEVPPDKNVYFVDFPDFLPNLKRVDNNNTFLKNAELVYDGPGEYDKIWKLKRNSKDT